jgi:hypothetical protein
VARILLRNGLVEPRTRRRKRCDYIRWERAEPMKLWQLDNVGGLMLVEGTEAKIVTGVDDCSRFNVIASVVVRATGRAVCLALAEALRRYGNPDEVLTDIRQAVTTASGRAGRCCSTGSAATTGSPIA